MLAFSVLSISAATKLTATPSLVNMSHYTYDDGYPATNATDGRYDTKFMSNAAQAPGQILMLTLNESSLIGEIKLYFEAQDQPQGADIQVSLENNNDWTTVASFTPSDIQISGSNYIYTCDANAMQGKYVRLYLTGTSNSWLRVVEFEVYESDVTKTATPVFDPSSTEFPIGTSENITITSADADAVIYYTTDETQPTLSSASIANGGTVSVPTNDWTKATTVKAIAKTADKEISNVATAKYTVQSPYCQPNVSTNGSGAKYVGQIVTLTTTGAEVNADWTNPRTENYNGYVGVIANTFTAKAGQTVTLNIASKNTSWGAIRVYADLNGDQQFSSDENIARVGDANSGSDNLAVSQEFTVNASTPAGVYLMRVFYVARANSTDFNSTDPCGTYTEGGYYDFAFNVEADAPVPTEDKEVTVSESETGDAAYLTVTVKADDATAAAPVWSIGANTVTAQALDIEVAADATTPEISISGNGSIAADRITVKRTVKADEWAFMSLPFAITVDNGSIQVGGAAAVINDNIKFLVYDGALRASSSIELFSGSGWTAKESGTIDANTGFAVAINSNNGDEQVVTFSATSFSMDASDKAVSLESHEATVNGGIDADWNFKGNPMLQSASKGDNYSLYIYNPSDDTYSEYAAAETAIFSPFAAWFVQSTNLNNGITFSHDGTTVAADAETNIDGRFAISINGGEDEARVTVLNGSSESYVINEDAMYFAPNSNKVAQVYLIDADGAKIASSVVPAPYNEVKLAYKAAVAGVQTLTVTSVIPGTAVYLVDNAEGTETLMNEGSEYNFTSEAGLNSERFAVKTIIDVTGIEESTAETSSVSAVVTGDAVKIYGATAGETIDVYTVNGVLVSSAVAVEGENEISVPAQGVLIVKVGDEVVKIVK